MRVESLSKVRASVPRIKNIEKPKLVLMCPQETEHIPSSLLKLREELISVLQDGFAIFVLHELYRDHPHIDHVNELYEDQESGVLRTLLHFAVATSDKELIKNLAAEYELEPFRIDSYGYNVLEFAYNEDLLDATYHLIKYVKNCALIPFRGYETFFHYAAANNRVDLLRAIRQSGFYDFQKPLGCKSSTPFELALLKKNVEAVQYFQKYNTFLKLKSLVAIYSKALLKIEEESTLAIFIVTFYKSVLYMKDPSGLDLMLLAIKHNIIEAVQYLIDNLYDKTKIDYDLLKEAEKLTESTEILDLIRNLLIK